MKRNERDQPRALLLEKAYSRVTRARRESRSCIVRKSKRPGSGVAVGIGKSKAISVGR